MITIHRNLARQVRAVFRRALGATRGGRSCPVTLSSGPTGLRIRAMSLDVAVEFRRPGSLPSEQFALPLEFLAACEGRREEPVHIEAQDSGQVLVQWRDGPIPQLVQYDSADPVDLKAFPPIPERCVANPVSLLKAMQDAAETTDVASTRYATNHVLLVGKSRHIGATDGRQLLLQNGFVFPWDEELLLPANKVFGCPELAAQGMVRIGRSENWFSLMAGPWAIHLRIGTDRRFPSLEHHVPQANAAAACCRLSPADAQFLLQALPRLPGSQDFNLPVTLDLNGSVAVRARDGHDQPVEVELSSSICSGQPMRVVTNRSYLLRAVKLGFREIRLFSPMSPVLCADAARRYVWALLDPESSIRPSVDALRISSCTPTAGSAAEDVQCRQSSDARRVCSRKSLSPV